MPKPFSPPGTPLRFAADRPFRVAGVRLELDLDLAGRRVSGAVTHRIEARQDALPAATFDAVELSIDTVVVDGTPVAFDHDGEKVRLVLPRPLARGAAASVTITYHASPRRGLYFVGPDAQDPARAPLCFTQGQDDDSRYYWPCIDAPNEKAPVEVIATAPTGNFLLSNGELRGRDELPNGRTRWHYVLEFPHPPYLVTVVCGPFTEILERAPETGVDVYFYAPPGREADARRSFARTAQMIDHFSARIGVPYPHRRYSQITVPQFIFGGMENTTAATLTDLILLDERAALDHDVDGLVSHELAHQWWGDLLTCREWSEAWLNEGFATYFEYVWREHAKGRDEADLELRNDAESYFAEAHRYQRPITSRRYDEPIHLFDGHTYDKGGRVMHMVRHLLGDGPFWEAIRAYATANARRSVETRDLARAIDDVTGRNLEPFFDRWVARAGHPEFECSWQWDDERKEGRLRVKQKQTISEELPAFQLDVGLHLEIGGKLDERTLAIREASHVFTFKLAARPQQVIFDPGDVVLKTIKFDKPAPLWRRQLEAAKLGIDRVLAAGVLGGAPDPDGVGALGRALATDPFWGVRAAAARALGKTRRQDALELLLGARAEPHPRVRRAVAAGLGEFRGDGRAQDLLTSWAKKGDPSLFVEAEVALALGKTRAPQAADILRELATRPSFQDTIRARAFEGLGALGGERAIAALCESWRPGGPFQSRKAAAAALGEAASGTPQARQAREFLEEHLSDPDFRVRGEIAAALARIGDRQAIGAIERTLASELDGRARRRMREAITNLREGSGTTTQVARLQEEMERLRTETTKLRERLDKLEARDHTTKPGPGPSGAARAPRRPRATTRRRARSHAPTRRR